MDVLDLPHIPGCLVCGRDVPHGLKLDFRVEPQGGAIHSELILPPRVSGFEIVSQTSLLGMVLDRAMNWAAAWTMRRFCLCDELTVRIRRPPAAGERLLLEARVEFSRPRLIQTAATLRTPTGGIVIVGGGKYVPMDQEQSDQLMQALVAQAHTMPAVDLLVHRAVLVADGNSLSARL